MFSLSPKTGIVRRGLKDASKRSAGRFAAFIPGAGVATKGREIKEKERKGGREGGRAKKGEKRGEKIKFFGGKTGITECIYRYVG